MRNQRRWFREIESLAVSKDVGDFICALLGVDAVDDRVGFTAALSATAIFQILLIRDGPLALGLSKDEFVRGERSECALLRPLPLLLRPDVCTIVRNRVAKVWARVHAIGSKRLESVGTPYCYLLVLKLVVLQHLLTWRQCKRRDAFYVERVEQDVLMKIDDVLRFRAAAIALLPDQCLDSIVRTENLVSDHLKPPMLVFVDDDEDQPGGSKKLLQQNESGIDHAKPLLVA